MSCGTVMNGIECKHQTNVCIISIMGASHFAPRPYKPGLNCPRYVYMTVSKTTSSKYLKLNRPRPKRQITKDR